jgi:DNA-binding CsgD family transcriptional regulator
MVDEIRNSEPGNYDKHLSDQVEFVSYTADKKQWAEDLLYRVKAIRKSKGSARITALNQLEKEILSHLNPENNVEAIWQKTKELNREFYRQLKQQYPELSRNELDFCGLIRMNISMIDIAILKNITLKSVNMARYRMKKKLELDPEIELDDFIQSF